MQKHLLSNKSFLIFFFLVVTVTTSQSQIRIKAVGDIMPGSYTPKSILPSDSGKIFESISSQFINADIVFGNLEGALINSAIKPVKCSQESRDKEICYEFGIPDYLINPLKVIGFNVLNNDNNHYSDYGTIGIDNTKRVVKSKNINLLSPTQITQIVIKGKKIAVIPFSCEDNSFNINDLTNAANIVSQAKQANDIVIISFHGGAEGSKAQHIKNETEIFLGEKRGNVIKFAKTVIDAGADLVLGHGPHVLRAIDLYKGKLIVYSLGNFLTYGNFNIKGVNGVSMILTLDIDTSTGNFKNGYITPINQHAPGIPQYDNDKKAIGIINQLINDDIEEPNLRVMPDGKIVFIKNEKGSLIK